MGRKYGKYELHIRYKIPSAQLDNVLLDDSDCTISTYVLNIIRSKVQSRRVDKKLFCVP